MGDTIKVLLVEDDELVRKSFRELISAHPHFRLVGETGRQDQAIQELEKNNTDVLLLDLELEEGDGVGLMYDLKESGKLIPFTIVVTNNRSAGIHDYLKNTGVDFICQKNNIHYEPKRVIELIDRTYRFHKKAHHSEIEERKQAEQKKSDEYYMRLAIQNDLQRLGCNIRRVGVIYTTDSILLATQIKRDILKITKDIYPAVAAEYNTSTSAVERCIRTTIEAIWSRADISTLEYYYPYCIDSDVGRPSNADFIINMARRIVRQ